MASFGYRSSLSFFFLVVVGGDLFPLSHASRSATDNDTDINMEQILIRDLIYSRRIDRYSRPVLRYGDAVHVQMQLSIFNVLGLNDQTEILSLNGILKLTWIDGNLTWTKKNYNDISFVHIADFMIWKPDIVLTNSANLRDSTTLRTWNFVRVHSTGKVEFRNPSTFNSHCSVDLSKFPFDEHECKLVFASWNFFAAHLNITIGDKRGSELQSLHIHQSKSAEWEITEKSKKVVYEKIDHDEWVQVIYVFRLRRAAPYYKFSVLLPVIVMMITSLAIFWFPPTAGEKVTFGGFMALILMLLLVHLYWVVPRNANNVPGIVLMCSMSVAYMGLSLLISVLTINLSRGYHYIPPPDFIRSLLSGCLGKVLFIGLAKTELEHRTLENNESRDCSSVETYNPTNKEWGLVAMAIDRLCFYFYVISFAILAAIAFA